MTSNKLSKMAAMTSLHREKYYYIAHGPFEQSAAFVLQTKNLFIYLFKTSSTSKIVEWQQV